MRRVAQLSVWVGAVLGVALVLALATSHATTSPVPAGPDDVAPVRLPPAPGLPDPADPGGDAAARAPGRQPAAPADVAASLTLVRNDVVLRRILGSVQYQVVGSQPWLNEAGDDVMGTELDLQLASPLSGPARLPGIRFNPDGKSYRQLMLNATISGATTLSVLVDLQSKRVVSVMPPDSTLSELPGNAHVTPASGPGGD
jgi:hypothetical protein